MPYQPLSDLTKARPGEPVRFAARWYNDVVDMLTWWRRQQKSSGSAGASGPGRNGCLIELRNDCGANRQTGEVLQIGSPIFAHSANAADYEANNLLYSGTQPASSSAGKWCLLLEPIASGNIGTAAVAGEWPAQVNFATATDGWAEVAGGSYNLLSNAVSGSAQVLSNDSGSSTGVQWAIVRLPFPPSGLVPFRNDDGATVPANGVICSYLTAYPASCPGFGDAANTNWPRWGTQFPGICASRVNYYQSYLMGWAGGYFINTAAAVNSHSNGLCTAATDQPTMALYSPDTGASTVTPLPGEIWGPAPGTFALYRGLPGFMVVGPVDTTHTLVGVVACHDASCWCAAKEAWHYGASFLPRYDRQCWVTCYPMTGPNGGQYDGSSRSPHVEILLNLRRGALWKDPNVVSGNTLCYHATSAQYGALAGGGGGSGPYFEPAGCDYLDEPVGSIKPFATAAPTGIQGWGVMNGTGNATGVGGSGIDGTSYQRLLRPGTPGITGGTWNHTHPLTSKQTANENFPYGTFSYAPDTAGPVGSASFPEAVAYAEIGGWLERLNNGQQ